MVIFPRKPLEIAREVFSFSIDTQQTNVNVLKMDKRIKRVNAIKTISLISFAPMQD